MKVKVFTHNSLITGIIALVLGFLLAYLQASFIDYFLMVAGCILIGYSIVDFIKFLNRTKDIENRWSQLPFSIVFFGIAGILILVFPTALVTIGEVMIAVFVMILALGKLMLLFQLWKNGVKVGIWYVIVPILLLGFSVFVVSNPRLVMDSFSLVFGIMIMAFGISEIFDYIIIHNSNLRKKFGSLSIQDAEEVKEEEHES